MIDLNRNAYGPCGHHRVNIQRLPDGSPGNCAICIAIAQERQPPREGIGPRGGQALPGLTTAGGVATVEEVVMGLDKPVTAAEVAGVLERYRNDYDRAVTEAEKLRPRIVKGKTLIAEADPTEYDLADARQRLDELEQALVHAEWQIALTAGAAFSYALGLAVKEENLRVPDGSVIRVRLPGILNLSMRLDERDA